MSVNSGVAPDILLFVPNPDYVDPYPVGMWRSHSYVLGDASGGIVTHSVAPAGAEGVKYLWSIEDYSLSLPLTPPADFYADFIYNTGEPVQLAGNVLQFSWTHLTGHSGIANMVDSTYHSRSYCHYICQPKSPYTFNFQTQIINTNGQGYNFDCWGYIWLPQSRRLAGGPRRP